MTPFNPADCGAQPNSDIPIILCHAPSADEAFQVYSALALLAVENDALGRLPLMTTLRAWVYDTFLAAFEVGQ